jgi:hypothetical protein
LQLRARAFAESQHDLVFAWSARLPRVHRPMARIVLLRAAQMAK